MINHTTFEGALTPDVLSAVIRVQHAEEVPLYAMMLGAGKVRTAIAERVSWFTSAAGSRRGQINNGGSAYTAGSTVLTVDDASIFRAGDTLVAEATNEIMLVQAVAVGANTISVTRGTGSVAAAIASVADDAFLMNTGNAHGEGSSSPTHRAASKVEVYNLLQTFRQAVEISGRMGRVQTLTEDERAFQRKEAFEQVVRDMEHAFLFGARNANLTDADGKRVTTMGGLRESVTTNVTNIGGTISKDELIDFAASAFTVGSRTKTLFAGPTLLSAIHKLYESQTRITQTVANVGLRIQAVETPHGTIRLVPHNSFLGSFAGDGILVDVDSLMMRPSKGGELQLKEDTQVKGDDATRDEMFSELSLEYGAEEKHAQIRGVTGAA